MSAFICGTICWTWMKIEASRDQYLPASQIDLTSSPNPASLFLTKKPASFGVKKDYFEITRKPKHDLWSRQVAMSNKSCAIKVHIFWEGHKMFAKSPAFFDWYKHQSKKGRDFAKFLWPSQNIWTLQRNLSPDISHRLTPFKNPKRW